MPKKSVKSSTKPNVMLLAHGYPDYSLPLSLPLLKMPQDQKLPPVSSEGGPRDAGLFSAYLGRPEPLFQDLVHDPSRYEEGVDVLLQRLISGETVAQLKPEEVDLLNRATLEFLQPTPKEPVVAQKEASKTSATQPGKDPWDL